MKNNKILVIILVLFLNIVVGFMVGQNIKKGDSEYENLLAEARSFTEEGLCSKAIDKYKEAILIEDSAEVRLEMIDTYEKGIDIGEFSKTYNIFADLETYMDLYRTDIRMYEKVCALYAKYGEYQKCATYLMQARDFSLSSETLDALREEYRYKYVRNYSMYTDVFPQLTGVYSVINDGSYKFVDSDGSTFMNDKFVWASNFNEGYAVVKQLSPDGTEQMFVVNKDSARQFYLPETAEASSGAAKINISEKESYLAFAIKDNGKYYYVDITGEKLLDGVEFEYAGRFRNNLTAIREGGKWYVMNHKGQKVTEEAFDDIILNEFEECAPKGLIFAKTGEKYHIYSYDAASGSFSQKGSFECDDAKAFVDDVAAFKSGDKWGFVNAEGNVVIEPEYEDAKSFSNGLAAVKVDPVMFMDEEDLGEGELIPVDEAQTQPAAEEEIVVDEPADAAAEEENTLGEEEEALLEEDECWAVINKDNRVVFEEGFQKVDYLSANGLLFVKIDDYWSSLTLYYTGK